MARSGVDIGERIFPVPRLLREAAVLRRLRRVLPFREEGRDVAVPEKLARVMKNELGVHRNARHPSRQVLIGVKMRFARTARRDIVAEALQLQRGSGACRHGKVLKSVERDHELLPRNG